MSYAPVSAVRTPPVPADTGLTLTVEEDTGARFPTVPFEALVWPVNTRPVYGTNACKLQVSAVDGDTLTFTRDDPTIEITAGLQIAVLSSVPTYGLGDTVHIADTLAISDGPYTYALQSPSGALGGFGTAEGVVDDGGGASHFDFTPDRSGMWRWKVLGQTVSGSDHAIFVTFSDTIR